jgi:hypothetical protein
MIPLYQIYDKKANPFVIFAGNHGGSGAAGAAARNFRSVQLSEFLI